MRAGKSLCSNICHCALQQNSQWEKWKLSKQLIPSHPRCKFSSSPVCSDEKQFEGMRFAIEKRRGESVRAMLGLTFCLFCVSIFRSSSKILRDLLGWKKMKLRKETSIKFFPELLFISFRFYLLFDISLMMNNDRKCSVLWGFVEKAIEALNFKNSNFNVRWRNFHSIMCTFNDKTNNSPGITKWLH